jgi:hypothetical protein
MELSKETLALIKNFASINGSIVLKQGKKLATISEGKNVMAEASIAESLPMDFPIYDLSEFLNVISLFPTTNLEFSEKYVTVSDGGTSKIKYFAAGEGLVKSAPSTVKFPGEDVTFKLDAAQLAMIQRTSAVLKAGDVSIVGDGTNLKVLVSDKKNATSNAYEVTIGETSEEFKANIKVENLKMLANDYDVAISKKKISRFKHTASDLTYYVAIEADSEF